MSELVADYWVISDNPIDLNLFNDPVYETSFELPTNAALLPSVELRGDSNVGAILSLMVHSMGPTVGCMASIRINGKKVWSYGPTNADLTRPFHEVVSYSENALVNGTNKFELRVDGGISTFRVSDIVLWYRKTV